MNDPMKRKEDVNQRGRANLEQTKTGKMEIQREITRRVDCRYAPTLQYSNVLSLYAILADISLSWGLFDKDFFFFLSHGLTFGESKVQLFTKLFNTGKEKDT